MIRAVAVSYLNTKPFTEGLEQEFSSNEMSLRLQVPSKCATSFFSGEANLALIPVGSLVDLTEVNLLDQYCIGAEGQVDSVFLFARKPLNQIETLFLDPHSRTSNGLARILFANHWKQKVVLARHLDYIQHIEGTTAGVVIGDRAIALRDQFPFVYDLAEAWKSYTGLSFAFAVWAYNPTELLETELKRVCKAFAWGMEQRGLVSAKWASAFEMSIPDTEHYLTSSIRYEFDANKQLALHRYLKELSLLDKLPAPKLTIRA